MNDRQAIENIVAQYLLAYEAQDAAGCADVYATDALVLSPWGPPARGRKEITSAHRDWFREGETNKVMRVSDLHVDRGTAFCLVTYEADIPESGKVFGASLNTFRQQPDGKWKILHTSLCELEDSETGFSK